MRDHATLALTNFALSKKSIQLLIKKGILDLFDMFGLGEDSKAAEIMQTNVAWTFLALCNQGIPGSVMLKKGITRDMFLVSCNPHILKIRHLVIAGFSQLGKSTNYKKKKINFSA